MTPEERRAQALERKNAHFQTSEVIIEVIEPEISFVEFEEILFSNLVEEEIEAEATTAEDERIKALEQRIEALELAMDTGLPPRIRKFL